MFSRFLVLALGVPVVAHAAWAFAGTEQANGIAVIQRAGQLSDIRSNNGKPFRLKATFKQFEMDVGDGSYTELWFSRRQWRRDIEVGDFSRTEADDNGNRWVDGADDFPGRTGEVALLLDITDIYSPVTKIEAVRQEDMQGTGVECVDTKEGDQSKTLCVDAKTGTLLLTKNWREHAGRRTAYACRYQQYERFGEHLFPHLVTCDEGEEKAVEIRVTELSSDLVPDMSLLSPTPAKSTNPACAGPLEAPQAIKKPVPVYPVGQPPGGTVTVALTVEANGRITDARVVHSLSKEFDQSALEAVKRWVFEPAKCDGKPMATRVNVVVEFVRP